MKDLHINQKSIINGVKRLIRGLCRESSRVKNTNHILPDMKPGTYSTVAEPPDSPLEALLLIFS